MSDGPIAAVEQLAGGIAAAHGCTVVAVHWLSHRIPVTLQITVQRSDGSDISLDECAGLSAPLSEAIDAAGLLTDAYVLEISSPGIGEELSSDRDFRSFRGFPIAVVYTDAKGAEQRSEGLLLERDDETVRLNRRGRVKCISRSDVIGVYLVTPQSDN